MKKSWVLLLILAAVMFIFAGCALEEEPLAQPGIQPSGSSATSSLDRLQLTTKITSEWEASGKQFLSSESHSLRAYNCARCHNGYVFAEQYVDAPDIRNGNVDEQGNLIDPYRTYAVGIDCQACHTGFGQELIDAGVVESASLGTVAAGKGALCIYCHDGRYDGGPQGQLENFRAGDRARTPHYSAAGILVTVSAIEYEDVSYPSGGHSILADTCVSCHMPQTGEGYASHTFGVKEYGMDDAMLQAGCGSCHPSVNRQFIADFQAEIKELADQVKAALHRSMEEVGLEPDYELAFGNNGAPAEMTEDQFIAAYNLKLIAGSSSETVSYDGTLGVHNPAYAKALLNESLKRLTAK